MSNLPSFKHNIAIPLKANRRFFRPLSNFFLPTLGNKSSILFGTLNFSFYGSSFFVRMFIYISHATLLPFSRSTVTSSQGGATVPSAGAVAWAVAEATAAGASLTRRLASGRGVSCHAFVEQSMRRHIAAVRRVIMAKAVWALAITIRSRGDGVVISSIPASLRKKESNMLFPSVALILHFILCFNRTNLTFQCMLLMQAFYLSTPFSLFIIINYTIRESMSVLFVCLYCLHNNIDWTHSV